MLYILRFHRSQIIGLRNRLVHGYDAVDKDYEDRYPGFSGRRLHLKTCMTVLREVDHVLSKAILDELETLPGVRIRGIRDRSRLRECVQTLRFTWEGRHPHEITGSLGEQGIYVWDSDCDDSSPSSALASIKSAVSNPSVNQP